MLYKLTPGLIWLLSAFYAQAVWGQDSATFRLVCDQFVKDCKYYQLQKTSALFLSVDPVANNYYIQADSARFGNNEDSLSRMPRELQMEVLRKQAVPLDSLPDTIYLIDPGHFYQDDFSYKNAAYFKLIRSGTANESKAFKMILSNVRKEEAEINLCFKLPSLQSDFVVTIQLGDRPMILKSRTSPTPVYKSYE